MNQRSRSDVHNPTIEHATPARPQRDALNVDVGTEAPLSPGGGLAAEIDRRGINLRWLGASVLTAVTGGVLLGTAIYVALQGDGTSPAPPERAPTSLAAPASSATAARKGDKLVRTDMTVAAKHSFRAPMTTRIGEREAIRVRSFTRVATSLSQTSGVYAVDIPPFNPLRLFAEESGERVAELPAEVGEADVSLFKRDLAALTVDPGAPALGDADAAAQIGEERRLAGLSGQRPAIPIPAQLMLSRTLRQPAALPELAAYARVVDEPFGSIEVLVVPENVTMLPKVERSAPQSLEEQNASLARGQTLEELLQEHGANPRQVGSIVGALGGSVVVAKLPEGQQVRLLVAPGARPGDPRRILRVVLYGQNGVEAIAAVNDEDVFVAVAPPSDETTTRLAAGEADEFEEDEREGRGGARLYESLYETALKHDLPKHSVEDLIRIFGYDVDFQRRVSSGDTFEIFYATDEDSPDRLEILYAALVVAGEERRVFRFHSPEDGTIDYFDELGRSLKKFLLRKPIAEGQLRSGFGMRRHPILGYSKMHTGVDWANRNGTPIFSAGNGKVVKAAWDGGYGRRVEIQHANGYLTSYSHMSSFGKGISAGARVRQGQVIGYVGNTGLSTGPHLHYEVIVNGRFVDPLKIRVPRGRELDGRALAEFKRQRDQVTGLIEKAGGATRLAQRETR